MTTAHQITWRERLEAYYYLISLLAQNWCSGLPCGHYGLQQRAYRQLVF